MKFFILLPEGDRKIMPDGGLVHGPYQTEAEAQEAVARAVPPERCVTAVIFDGELFVKPAIIHARVE